MTVFSYIPQPGEIGKVYYWSNDPGTYWSFLAPSEDPENYSLHRLVSTNTVFVLTDCEFVIDREKLSIWWEKEKRSGHTREQKRSLAAGVQGKVSCFQGSFDPQNSVKFCFDKMVFVYGAQECPVPLNSAILFARGAYLIY